MSAEANKAIARRFVEEVLSQGHLDVVDEIFAADHVISGPGALPGLPVGPEGTKMQVTVYRSAFPDLHYTVDEQVADEQTVVTRWTGTGTQLGPLGDIPATGKSVSAPGVNIERVADGKIVETWVLFDQLGLLQQLGVIPTPGQ
jgi:steroid delta-isomerase-like uncharacterized protein